MGRAVKHPETICWGCQNAIGRCNWSRELKPVDGWDVIPRTIKASKNGMTDILESYIVLECPEFIADGRSERNECESVCDSNGI